MVQWLDCRIIKFLCRHCAAFSFCREVVKLAATRLIALHKNKGKSVAACLKSRTDYAQNPDKTQQGELVSSYECSPLTVDEEFMLSKRQYELMTGRRQKNDVIAYQIRQSFKPGEITAEEANKVGYKLAMRFTKGKYAFIVATHTDREHIHNHIIYNSTALDSTRKFRDFLLSGLAVQRLSDLICLEHQLSVIEIKPYRERQKRTLYPPKESNRDKLCSVIDGILLDEKPANFEAFLQKLEQQGYEIKRGKHTSVKGARRKRFIRFRTLGVGYSEDEIKAVIAGEVEHRPHQKQPPKEQSFHLLVDIQAKLSEGKGEGYARWAKRYNLKEMSKTLIFLQENKIGSIEEMQERVDAATAHYHELGDSIKASEKRLAAIAVLKAHIINYAKTRPVYDAYRNSGYSKKFLEAHREQITLHKAAKAAFDETSLKKLPKVKELDAEYAALLSQKKAAYPAYIKLSRTETAAFSDSLEYVISHPDDNPDIFPAILKTLDEFDTKASRSASAHLAPLLRHNVFQNQPIKRHSGIEIINLSKFPPLLQKTIADLILFDEFRTASQGGQSPRYIYIDEMQNLSIDKDCYLGKILTEGRKYALNVILASQSIREFKASERTMLCQANHKLLFHPALLEVKYYAELLASPQHRAEISDLLRNLEVGQCVFQGPIYIGEDTKPTRAPICVNVSHLEDIASAPLSKSNS